MNNLKNIPLVWVLVLLISVSGSYQAQAAQIEPQTLYYGVEINGVLCGYVERNVSPAVIDGKEMTLEEENVFVMLSALGSKFNTEVKSQSYIDPATGGLTYLNSEISQGDIKLGIKVVIEDNIAHYTSTMSPKTKDIELPPDVILGDSRLFSQLIKDFTGSKIQKKRYKTLEIMDGEIQESTYTKVRTEELELAGNNYKAIIFDHLNHKTGLKIKWWVDTETSHMLKADLPNNRKTFLTDRTVVDRIKLADVDENLFAKVDVAIADVQAISYMKVKATVEPIGLWVTQEGLNVPGQSFTGTINDNLIEGVFEIEHKRYDGSDAPPYPADFSRDESVKKYLEPEKLLESDDPVLIKKAQEIAEGSKDSWEAACRLSKWVSENISYAIPGGGTARKTYDIKAGECGAHSLLLAAFCRAVGIPARVVWGCMYVPNYGGAFGQHGWSEIYMGRAGWITVDTTASEIDYVDSGHIRIGEYQSMATALNPKKMEVLDFTAGSMKMGLKETASGMYSAYVGEYTNPNTKTVLKVFVQGGSLAVDIPGKVILALNDPDEKGLWYCKLSDQLYFTFKRKYLGFGKVEEMHLHQIIPLPRKSGPQNLNNNVPAKYRPYLGKYSLAALQAEFTVIYKDGGLAVDDPLNKKVIKLQSPNEKGRWVDEFNKNSIFFDMDNKGNVTAMKIDSVDKFTR
ncbi:MAG: transglutaminase-like domain-containing protein [Planctomycetota bacterium]|jgi:transglutaminase-like putative cysteine protease